MVEPGSSSAATNTATSSSSLSSSATAPATSSATSPGSSPFIFSGASGSPGPSQFAPLFSSSAPAPPTPAPRHPIFFDHITNHIKFLLNSADHNYHRWKSFFLLVLVRYGVTFLIKHPPPLNADAQYLELDAHVVLWIYATLADPLIDHVVGATTMYALWTKIQAFFLANRAARFTLLNRQYRNLKQGDLSITAYARRLKLPTDGLTDITTQFLHGLDKRLDTIRVVLGD